MSIDWEALFVPQNSLLELLIRGTFVYLLLFVLLRVIIGRRVWALSMTDLLLVVLIADAAQNGMAGEYTDRNASSMSTSSFRAGMTTLSFARSPFISHTFNGSTFPVRATAISNKTNIPTESTATNAESRNRSCIRLSSPSVYRRPIVRDTPIKSLAGCASIVATTQ
jgi:hypothetical protein